MKIKHVCERQKVQHHDPDPQKLKRVLTALNRMRKSKGGDVKVVRRGYQVQGNTLELVEAVADLLDKPAPVVWNILIGLAVKKFFSEEGEL